MSKEKEDVIVFSTDTASTASYLYYNKSDWVTVTDGESFLILDVVSADSRCRKEELPYNPLNGEDKQQAIAYLRELDLPVYASLDLENGGYRVINNHSRVVMHLRGTVEQAELMVKLLNALPALLLA